MYFVCDCSGFIVGATLDLSGQVLPPNVAPLAEGWGTEPKGSVPSLLT